MIKLSPKQLEFFHESNARINIAEGAVRSGKSYIILQRFMKELYRDGPEGEYIVTGKSQDTCERNIITPLQNLTGHGLAYNQGKRYFHLFGKKVYVVGANDERASSKIKGATFAGALVDEVTELPESYFQMLFSRLSIKGSKLFGGTNPDSPYHWLKVNYIDRFTDQPEYFRDFRFVLDDNPSLDQQIKDDYKRTYQGFWYKRFILGEWVMAEGAVYDFIDSNIHYVDSPPTYAKYYLLGIDYGTTNPFAAVLLGFNDDHKPCLWVEKEYYWDSKIQGYQKTDAEYAEDIEREFGGYSPSCIYLDPSAASFQTELRRHKMPVKSANNDVLDGIRCVSNLISQGNLVICKSCKNLIKEIEGYVWDESAAKRGEDKPSKVRDHAVDALRYPIFTHFGKKMSLKETSKEDVRKKAPTNWWSNNPMGNYGHVDQFGWQKM